MSPERRRLTLALLLSLLIHALLLSLTFGGQGLWLSGSGSSWQIWLPGFAFPWQDRRIEVPDLRVVVVPAQVTAAEPAVTPVVEPLQQAGVEQPVASAPALTPLCLMRGPRGGLQHRSRRSPIRRRRPDQVQTARPLRPLPKRPCAAIDPVTRRPRRSLRRPDRLGAERRAHVGRAYHPSDANAPQRDSAKRVGPGDRDAAASRSRRCRAGANRPRSGRASR